MPYPGKPVPEPLPRFRGTATTRQTPQQRADLIAYAADQYEAGRSLRDIAALTDRTQTAIRRALAQAGVPLRGRGAPTIIDQPTHPLTKRSPLRTSSDPGCTFTPCAA